MRTRPTVALCAVVLAAVTLQACGDAETTTTTSPPTPESTIGATTVPTTTEPPVSTLVESVCTSGTIPFADRGTVARLGEATGDAEQIAAVRWASHPGCERVVIDLLTAGAAPASTVGETTVAILEGTGIVRVSLPRAVSNTGIADSLFEGELAKRAFVVRLADRSLAVDVHVATSVPVRARAFTVDAPARIVIDLAPSAAGGTTVATPPIVGSNVVVLAPLTGEVAYPIVVTGYARTFEANVLARLLSDGDLIDETFTTASDWLDAWGAFSLELPGGPSGPVSVFVGEDDAADGSPRGVSIDVMVP
ncbi:MAG: Gmad2 immunoglobulin-like domain-containing protein [Acidimicrobiia bacterium]|nr:Gmad2 immunoglobulin-like domain-containing protein [Acidimicrobiia bacterium]